MRDGVFGVVAGDFPGLMRAIRVGRELKELFGDFSVDEEVS